MALEGVQHRVTKVLQGLQHMLPEERQGGTGLV